MAIITHYPVSKELKRTYFNNRTKVQHEITIKNVTDKKEVLHASTFWFNMELVSLKNWGKNKTKGKVIIEVIKDSRADEQLKKNQEWTLNQLDTAIELNYISSNDFCITATELVSMLVAFDNYLDWAYEHRFAGAIFVNNILSFLIGIEKKLKKEDAKWNGGRIDLYNYKDLLKQVIDKGLRYNKEFLKNETIAISNQ